MYKRMTTKEKMNYLYVQNKGMLIGASILAIISIFISLISKETSWHNITSFILVILLAILIIVFIIKLFYPVNIFSKNVQITDGYIDVRSEYSYSDGERSYFGTAKTLDGSKSTKKKRIPFWFRHGKVPVKIIVYNDKACDYIITKESYDFVDEHRGELERKKDKNQSIIGIILLIIILVGIIVSML